MARKNDREERALLNASIEGDSEAFEALYLQYMEKIYRYIFFRVGDEAQAEDMTEEVFVKAWEALPKYKLGEHPFSSWLYRIAHNLLVDHYRRNNPSTISTDDLALEQQVVLLRFVEGLSHREIGSMIGKSASASRVIQHRALKTLHALLSRRGFANV